jgi:hypothetical protein
VDHNSTVAHSESYTPKDLGCQHFNVQHNYNGALHIAIGTLPFEACLVFLRKYPLTTLGKESEATIIKISNLNTGKQFGSLTIFHIFMSTCDMLCKKGQKHKA